MSVPSSQPRLRKHSSNTVCRLQATRKSGSPPPAALTHHMHRGDVRGWIGPRLSDNHARSSFVGFCAALDGSGGRGAAGSPQANLALNLLLLGVRQAVVALFTGFHSSGDAKSHASKEG